MPSGHRHPDPRHAFPINAPWSRDPSTAGGGDLTGALEYYHYDGPWDRPDDYQRFNGYLGYSRGDALGGWSVTAMGSDGEWLATDQTPAARGRRGTGRPLRHSRPRPARHAPAATASPASTTAAAAHRLTSVSAYVIRYDFNLISNFTYFLDDPVNGDQFEQQDERWISGLGLDHRWSGHLGAAHADTAVGLDLRCDDIANGLYRTTDLVRTSTTRQDDIGQLGGGIWGESWIQFSPALRLNLGAAGRLLPRRGRCLSGAELGHRRRLDAQPEVQPDLPAVEIDRAVVQRRLRLPLQRRPRRHHPHRPGDRRAGAGGRPAGPRQRFRRRCSDLHRRAATTER